MGKKFLFSFFVLGLSSIFCQTIFLREAILSFYGNEFFVGICLGFWLIWVALGSLFFSKFLKSEKFFVLIHILVPLFLFLEIFLLRFIKTFGMAGEIPNFLFGILAIFFISFPLCFFLGSWWSLGTKIFSKFFETKEITNKAYLLESFGFFFGGIFFSFFLVNFNEFLVSFILFFLNFLVVIYLKPKIIFVFLFLTSFLIFPFLDKLNFLTFSLRFKNQELVNLKNSPFGNLAVTKIDSQFNFYQNGVLLGSNYDFQFAEEFTHLSLLQKEKSEKILLIGGGFSGILNEILKHPVEKIYYLEIDPNLIKIFFPYLTEETKKSILHPKVKIVFEDGFYFLKKNNEKFDFILLNLPPPSTALINRFYTLEFFQMVKQRLSEDGVFAFHLPFSPSFLNKNLENLNRIIFQTLKNTFKEVFILPEENIIFLASEKQLIKDSEILISRKKEREIETKFLTEDYIKYRYTNDRIEMAFSLFEKKSKINKISQPVAYFYQILFWQDTFYPRFTKIFEKVSSNFEKIFISLELVLFFFILKIKNKIHPLLPLFSIFVAGFSIMALENLILISFQNFVGYLYFKISLLISIFMLGMALGVYFWSKRKKANFSTLFKLHFFLILFCLIFIFLLSILPKIKSKDLIEFLILISAFLTGFLSGGFFPIANRIYLSFQKTPSEKTGLIYSFDLFGAFLGSFLTSLIFLPLFGIYFTLFSLISINLLFLFLKVNSN